MNVYLVGPNSFFHSANTLDPIFGRGPVLAAGDTAVHRPEAATLLRSMCS